MKAIFPAGALLAPILLAACTVTLDSQSQIARDEKRFTVSGTPNLHLTTFDGAIEIQSWDKPDVLVEVEKRGSTREAVEALEVKSSQSGDRIDVEVVKPRSTFSVGVRINPTARFTVWLPRASDVTAHSDDGSIVVEHLKGHLDLHTGDGSIRVTDVSGELSLNTGDGSVTADDVDGRLGVETGDGGVSVSGNLSALRL